MKTMDFALWLGANRSHSRSYGEDEQQRHGAKDAFSCCGNCEADREGCYISRAGLLRLSFF